MLAGLHVSHSEARRVKRPGNREMRVRTPPRTRSLRAAVLPFLVATIRSPWRMPDGLHGPQGRGFESRPFERSNGSSAGRACGVRHQPGRHGRISNPANAGGTTWREHPRSSREVGGSTPPPGSRIAQQHVPPRSSPVLQPTRGECRRDYRVDGRFEPSLARRKPREVSPLRRRRAEAGL